MRRFVSKRNEVFLRDGLVYKRTKDPQSALLEAGILRELRGRGVAVPEVLDCREGTLVLEYLPGEPLPDVIERGGYDTGALAGALCAWFGAFYAAVPTVPAGTQGEARGDVNGRNYLCQFGSYDGARIYSVDFEERCYGHKARDAGRLAAYMETYRTCDPESQMRLAETFMQGFAERFGCAMDEILTERERECAAMRLRRL